MKKLFLSIIALAIAFPTFAQWTNQSGTGNYYLNSGNVGIGTTTPATSLDVVGITIGTPTVIIHNNSYNTTIRKPHNKKTDA